MKLKILLILPAPTSKNAKIVLLSAKAAGLKNEPKFTASKNTATSLAKLTL